MSGTQSADSAAADRKAPGNLDDTEEGSEGLSEEENMETSSCQDNTSGLVSDVKVTDSDKDDISAASPSVLKGEGDWTDNLTGLRLLLETGGTGGTAAEPGDGHPSEGLTLCSSTKQSSKGLVEQDSASVEDRARAYVKKKKDALVEERKSCLGPTLLTYEAVCAANKRKLSAPYLQSGVPTVEDQLEADGDFFSSGDGRVNRMYMDCNLPMKLNAAFSFNPWKKMCTSCAVEDGHPVLGNNPGDCGRSLKREVVLLSDQAYPPLLPSNSGPECIRIIRLEYGSLFDLSTTLIELMEHRRLSHGSIVLLFSASHLARVGLTAYVEDLVTAKRRLSTTLGDDLYFTAAPPLLMGGTTNSELVKNIFALTGWVTNTLPEEIRLDKANEAALKIILDNGYGGSQQTGSSRVRLPASINKLEPCNIWSVGSNHKLPNFVKELSEEQEELLITTLINELQVNLALDLDSSPSFDRNPGPEPKKGSDCYLVVGSSNARRLCDALNQKGIETGFVISQNWRATKKSVADMAAHIEEEMSLKTYTAVIFQLLDNNFYFVRGEDGGKAPPSKGKDGHSHGVGDLARADKDSQFAILKLCEPLWSTARGKHMVIVGPMARFVSAGCCSDSTHVANRNSREFYLKLKEDLVASCSNIKDFLFTSGMRHGRVMDPARSTSSLVAAEIWGSDPIHPKPMVYEMLADGVVAVEKGCGSARTKRKKSTDTAASGGRSDRGGAGTAAGRGGDQRPYQNRGGTNFGGGNRGFSGGFQRGHPSNERGDSRGGGGGARGGGNWRGGPPASWRGGGYGRGRRGWAGGR